MLVRNVLVALCLLTAAPAAQALPSFPGAEGFGTQTPGGRGGVILRVTNLNDSGPGSLRAAVQATGARIVIFDVSGTIQLSNWLIISNPYIAIAGQTAPSPGITLRGAGISVGTNDVVIQHLRIRPGDDAAGAEPDNRDALQILGSGGKRVVIDHNSFSWAIDENVSTWYSGVDEITLSHNIVSEGLSNSLHPKGEHSKGVLLGFSAHRVAILGNLIADNVDRNPWFQDDVTGVLANNLIYNWRDISTAVGSDDPAECGADGFKLSIVGNAYIPGPSTSYYAAIDHVIRDPCAGRQLYVSDNYLVNVTLIDHETPSIMVTSPPVWPTPLTLVPGASAETRVLNTAGARHTDNDVVDQRIVSEVRARTGRIIDSPSQVGGYPTLAQNTRTLTVPANPNGDDDGDGYTNIEELLQQMAAQVEGSPAGSACDLNHDGVTNVVDVQGMVNQAIGVAACTADLNRDGLCNVIDVQRVVNAAQGGPCVSL